MSAFRTLLVAGQLRPDAGAALTRVVAPLAAVPVVTAAALASRLESAVPGRIRIDCPVLDPTQIREVLGERDRLVDYRQVSDLSQWAPPGAVTYLIAHHEDPHETPPWGSLQQLVNHWAGQTSADVPGDLYAPTGSHRADSFATQFQRARKNIAGRYLRVLATTDRPLLGMASTLALTPAFTPSQITATSLQEWQSVARQVAQLGGAHLLPAGGEVAPALRADRLRGGGAGWGIGLLAQALGGQVLDAWEAMAQLAHLDRYWGIELAIVLCPPLHSHTVAYTPVPVMGQWAQGRAIPLVAFTTVSTLSRFEAAQWGLQAVYTLRRADLEVQIEGILRRTWLR